LFIEYACENNKVMKLTISSRYVINIFGPQIASCQRFHPHARTIADADSTAHGKLLAKSLLSTELEGGDLSEQ
jgi:hypothetical protein